MKAIAKYLFIRITLGLAICIGLFFWLIPVMQIEQLRRGYVAVSVNENQEAEYKLVDFTPFDWVRLKDIDHTAAHAIVISEDWAFYEHPGYDIRQIKMAIYDAVTKLKPLRGASTITQQLVKNLFLTPEKSLWRKLKEAAIAAYLETRLPKEKILETYLNIIQYGKGLYGIKAASHYYFKIPPQKLGAKEGAFLAMLLPNPERYSSSFEEKKLSEFAREVVETILFKLKVAKYISEDEMHTEEQRKFSWEAASDDLSTQQSSTIRQDEWQMQLYNEQ